MDWPSISPDVISICVPVRRPIVGAGLAAGRLRIGLGRVLGKGRRLPLVRLLGLLQQLRQPLVLGFESGDQALELRDASLKPCNLAILVRDLPIFLGEKLNQVPSELTCSARWRSSICGPSGQTRNRQASFLF